MNQIFLTTKRALAVVLITTVAAIAVIVSTQSASAIQAVAVTATVTSSVSCTTDIGSSSFGTLSIAGISSSTPATNVSNSCNSGGGCTIYVNDAGNGGSPGLYAAAATSTPLIASATATLATSSEGYGIQAATTGAGSGGTLTLSSTYLKTGANVGGLTIAPTQIASSTVPIASRIINVSAYAAISGLTKAGSYADTITYSCSGN